MRPHVECIDIDPDNTLDGRPLDGTGVEAVGKKAASKRRCADMGTRDLGDSTDSRSLRFSNTSKSPSKATSARASKPGKTGVNRRAHDAVTAEMSELLSDSGFFAQASEEVVNELCTLTRDLEPLAEPDAHSRLGGAAASEFTERLVAAWTTHSTRQLTWPSAKLLYAVRRLPLEMMVAFALVRLRLTHDASSAAIGVERLLSVCTGLTRRSEAPVRTTLSSYQYTTEELKDLTHHVLRITHLWLLHGTARIVGKGGDIEVDPHGFPVPIVDTETAHAMAQYDERLKGMTLDGIVGTDVWDITTKPGPLSLLTVSALEKGPVWKRIDGVDRTRITAAQIHLPHPAQTGDVLHVLEKFEIDHLDLTRFRDVIAGATDVADGLSPELPSLIVLLHGLAKSQDDDMKLQLQRYGYLRVSRDLLWDWMAAGAEILPTLLPHVRQDRTALFLQLNRPAGRTRPLTDGPVMHPAGDNEVLVDVATASRRLPWELLVGKDGGSLGSARGDDFELVVRARMRAAGAEPQDPALRNLEGRTITISGAPVTDLDALAELGDGTVLVIQVKSFAYTPEYGAGQFAAVRSLTTNLLHALDTWPGKVARIFSSPANARGVRFPDRRYVPIVVTPFPAYLPATHCDSLAMDDLPICLSLVELEEWVSPRARRTTP
ncbi:hypothetical protein IFU40_13095 [Microbacterium sp. CFBP 13617]|uniref:hypothetical protein n=1 Tax=Microbacterium sp. CFBP 13617 TaxID=2774035 RepID=UPI0017840D41|nr:hypothetical protein [Microbacterium sp. CFBP 13617]MBD8219570.1 hypothetical protein [Microbacterium sp. CFBP 13617]